MKIEKKRNGECEKEQQMIYVVIASQAAEEQCSSFTEENSHLQSLIWYLF